MGNKPTYIHGYIRWTLESPPNAKYKLTLHINFPASLIKDSKVDGVENPCTSYLSPSTS